MRHKLNSLFSAVYNNSTFLRAHRALSGIQTDTCRSSFWAPSRDSCLKQHKSRCKGGHEALRCLVVTFALVASMPLPAAVPLLCCWNYLPGITCAAVLWCGEAKPQIALPGMVVSTGTLQEYLEPPQPHSQLHIVFASPQKSSQYLLWNFPALSRANSLHLYKWTPRENSDYTSEEEWAELGSGHERGKSGFLLWWKWGSSKHSDWQGEKMSMQSRQWFSGSPNSYLVCLPAWILWKVCSSAGFPWSTASSSAPLHFCRSDLSVYPGYEQTCHCQKQRPYFFELELLKN